MIENAVVEYLANSIWQVPMVAAIAWVLIWIGKPGARVQHNVWLAALALSVLLPLLKPRDFTIRPAQSASEMQSAESQPAQMPQPVNTPGAASSRVLAAGNGQAGQMPWLRVRTLRLSQHAVDWLLGIYLAIVFFRSIQLAFAWRAAQKMVTHASERKLSASQQTALEQFCARFRVPEPPVLVSREISGPINVGIMRPTVLLPETLAQSTGSEMAAILCHELAHIRRCDYLANWIYQLGSLPIAYHPATHGLHRRIRQTRELVCDAMAADAMRSATGYARCLVTLAQRILNGESPAQQMQAPGLFDHDGLEGRIMRLLERRNKMSTRAKVLRITGATALTAAAMTVAAIFHLTPAIVHAADTTAQVATPAAVPQAAPPTLPTPAASNSPVPVPNPSPGQTVHPRGNSHLLSSPRHTQSDLTPEQRARMEQDLAAANAQIQEATKRLQSPEFKKQMADMQQQVAEAAKKLQSAEVQRQMQMLQSPEFKKQMADMQSQIAAATKNLQSNAMRQQLKTLQSPEFKKQMADMQQQVAEAAKKLQSAEVQRQMQILQSPEFKKQMADMQRKIAEASKQLDSGAIRLHGMEMPQPNAPSAQSNKRDLSAH